MDNGMKPNDVKAALAALKDAKKVAYATGSDRDDIVTAFYALIDRYETLEQSLTAALPDAGEDRKPYKDFLEWILSLKKSSSLSYWDLFKAVQSCARINLRRLSSPPQAQTTADTGPDEKDKLIALLRGQLEGKQLVINQLEKAQAQTVDVEKLANTCAQHLLATKTDPGFQKAGTSPKEIIADYLRMAISQRTLPPPDNDGCLAALQAMLITFQRYIDNAKEGSVEEHVGKQAREAIRQRLSSDGGG